MRTDVYPHVSEQSTNESTWRQRLSEPILSWIGIIGGAITLFSNLEGVLKLADWARFIVVHWHEWTNAFWSWVFGWIGIEIPALVASYLTTLSFFVVLAMSIRIRTTVKWYETVAVPWYHWAGRPVMLILLCIFLFITVNIPLTQTIVEGRYTITHGVGNSVVPLVAGAMYAISPRPLFVRRMWTVVVVVILLLAGNELSKLDLIPYLTPPSS